MRFNGFLISRPLATAPRPLAPATRVASGRVRRTAATAVLAALVSAVIPGAAAAYAGPGGAAVSPSPAVQAKQMVVRKISCLKGCSSIAAAPAGSTLRFQGPRLTKGRRVVYLGGAGTADDVRAQIRIKRSGRTKLVTATLPKRAKSGPVAIEINGGARTAASESEVEVQQLTPVALIQPLEGAGPFFPVVGAHKYGTGAATFGGGRGHQGFDVFAKCGTPLVTALAGKVKYEAFQSRAGNYIVYDTGEYDIAYMHMVSPTTAKVGDELPAGTQVGNVGDTGRADGCHLHIELWKGNWQGVGGPRGTPIDPLPTLKEWDAASSGTRARVAN